MHKCNIVNNKNQSVTQETKIYVVWHNEPTISTGGHDLEEIHHQKDGVQRVMQRKSLKSKSSNTPKSHFHAKDI
jgi:hypothetical protein